MRGCLACLWVRWWSRIRFIRLPVSGLRCCWSVVAGRGACLCATRAGGGTSSWLRTRPIAAWWRATTAPLAAHERGTTGSHVPHQSPGQARATSMPETTWPISRHPPGSSQASPPDPVSISSKWFRHVISRSLTLAFLTHTRRAQRRAVSATLTTTTLDRSSLRWFATSPCRAIAEDHQPNRPAPPSPMQHRIKQSDLLHRASLSRFVFTRGPTTFTPGQPPESRAVHAIFVAEGVTPTALPLLNAAGPKENCGTAPRPSARMVVVCECSHLKHLVPTASCATTRRIASTAAQRCWVVPLGRSRHRRVGASARLAAVALPRVNASVCSFHWRTCTQRREPLVRGTRWSRHQTIAERAMEGSPPNASLDT